VDLRLPPDAVLRWPPQAAVLALGEANDARLAALADQLERSFAALDRVHEDPRSGISNLARRLFRSESASWAGLAGVPRVWAEQRRRPRRQSSPVSAGGAAHGLGSQDPRLRGTPNHRRAEQARDHSLFEALSRP
jgi:hypothetical protein